MNTLSSILALSIVLAVPLSACNHADVASSDVEKSRNATLEDTKTQRAKAYVAAFNSADPDIYEDYMQTHRARAVLDGASAAQRRDSMLQLQEMFGRLDIIEIDTSQVSQIRLITRNAQGEKYYVMFSFEDTPEAKVKGINFDMAPPDLIFSSDWATLEDLLQDFVAKSGIPAMAVAVVKNGRIIDQAAVGQISIEDEREVQTAHSRFHWGSVSKSVTGTVIGALIKSGKLDWDTTLGEIFPDVQMKDGYSEVTVTELAAHRSGIPPYGNFNKADVDAIMSKHSGTSQQKRYGWMMDILRDDAPIFPPGKGNEYSNAGYTLLGVIAETVSGKSWQDLVEEHVFKPAGMIQSGFGWPSDLNTDHQPMGHFGRPGEFEIMPAGSMRFLKDIMAPAGDVHSTIGDFAAYARLHLQGLTEENGTSDTEWIRKLHTPLPEELQRPEAYSFGWGQVNLPDGKKMHWHNGGAGSYYAEIRLIPESDVGFVIMANAGYGERLTPVVWDKLYSRYVVETQ